MNVLTNFTNQYRVKGEVALAKRDLVLFAVALLREADRLEKANVRQNGKAAIEFLLNMKYQIVEHPKLETHTKDQLLAEVDGVIKKFVSKYQIEHKKGKFYFDESLAIAIVHPEVAGEGEQQILADIYALKSELETLKIQLARTPLQSSACLQLKAAILDKEKLIKEHKLKLIKQKYFSTYDDSQAVTTKWRRSLGESSFSRKRK